MVAGAGLVHRAVLHRSLAEAAEVASALLEDALARGRTPIVAALRPAVEALVRGRLGTAAGAVTFLPPRRHEGDHLRHGVPGRGPRPAVVSEVDPDGDLHGSARLETELLGALRHGLGDEEHTCLYPHAAPFERIARASHPVLHQDGVDEPNPGWRGAEALLAQEPALAHLHPDARTHDVVPLLDPGLRAHLARSAREIGLDATVVDQLVLVAHEAVLAGARSRATEGRDTPGTRLYVRGPGPATGAPMVLDVDAAWLPPLPPDRPAPGDSTVALWLARGACPDIAISVHALSARRCRIHVTTPPGHLRVA